MAVTAPMLASGIVGAEEISAPAHLEASLITERLENVEGGLRRGGRSMVDLAFVAQVDLARLVNAPGLSFSGTVRYDSPGYMSAGYVGDAQGVSNIDAPEAWRLYEFWLNWQVGAAAFGAGLYDLNSEFDVLETASLFLNGSHGIGPEIGLSGRSGPSIFPVTGLALRFSYDWSGTTLRLAALDGQPGNLDRASSIRTCPPKKGRCWSVRSNARCRAATRAWACGAIQKSRNALMQRAPTPVRVFTLAWIAS